MSTQVVFPVARLVALMSGRSVVSLTALKGKASSSSACPQEGEARSTLPRIVTTREFCSTRSPERWDEDRKWAPMGSTSWPQSHRMPLVPGREGARSQSRVVALISAPLSRAPAGPGIGSADSYRPEPWPRHATRSQQTTMQSGRRVFLSAARWPGTARSRCDAAEGRASRVPQSPSAPTAGRCRPTAVETAPTVGRGATGAGGRGEVAGGGVEARAAPVAPGSSASLRGESAFPVTRPEREVRSLGKRGPHSSGCRRGVSSAGGAWIRGPWMAGGCWGGDEGLSGGRIREVEGSARSWAPTAARAGEQSGPAAGASAHKAV